MSNAASQLGRRSAPAESFYYIAYSGRRQVNVFVSLSSASRPLCRPARVDQRLLEEEAQYLPGGIGSSRIGVETRGTSARSGMAGSVDNPLLQDRPPALIVLHGATIGMPARHPVMRHAELQGWRGGLLRPSDDGDAIARVHRGVLITMEHDRRKLRRTSFGTQRVPGSAYGDSLCLPHGGERRRQI